MYAHLNSFGKASIENGGGGGVEGRGGGLDVETFLSIKRGRRSEGHCRNSHYTDRNEEAGKK